MGNAIALVEAIPGRHALAGRSPAVVRLSIDRIEKNIESIESKITKIFKRPKNREDGSDFDDFRTKKIAATQAV